jgi:hypothetical protein
MLMPKVLRRTHCLPSGDGVGIVDKVPPGCVAGATIDNAQEHLFVDNRHRAWRYRHQAVNLREQGCSCEAVGGYAWGVRSWEGR